ncbi:MAG: hypothetical protein ABI671_20790 [Burkholderiales bacterium]
MAPPRALTPIPGGSLKTAALRRAPLAALPPSTSHILQSSRAPAQLSLFQRPGAAR